MKIFHYVVAMGAAMVAGCGAGEEPSPANEGADATEESAEPPDETDSDTLAAAEAGCPQSGGLGLGFGCAYAGSCRGTSVAPISPNDCARPQQLHCSTYACTCDKTAPLVPADCPHTAQFTCDDWTLPCGCRCNLSAPLGPAVCGCLPIVVPDAMAGSSSDAQVQTSSDAAADATLDAAADASDASDASRDGATRRSTVPLPSCPFVCHSYRPPVGCYCSVIR